MSRYQATRDNSADRSRDFRSCNCTIMAAVAVASITNTYTRSRCTETAQRYADPADEAGHVLSASAGSAPHPQICENLLGRDHESSRKNPFADRTVDRGRYLAGGSVSNRRASNDLVFWSISLPCKTKLKQPATALGHTNGPQAGQKYPFAGRYRPRLRALH